MGNILKRLCKEASNLRFNDQDHGDGEAIYQGAPLGPHGKTVGCAALARDLHHFEATGQVPEELRTHVQSSTNAQANWYKKLLTAWKAAQPPPSNTREASELVIQTLHGHRKVDVEGLLSFYELSSTPAPAALHPEIAAATGPWRKGVQLELHSLPVASKDVSDGDTLTIYVDTSKNPKETAAIPGTVVKAFRRWKLATKRKDIETANALEKEILSAGYKVVDSNDGRDEILARKYKVRLRGVDAPEKKMPFGPDAKSVLLGLVEGQPLHVLVYSVDRFGRIVADVHCKNGFVQEILLKKGCVWHYTTYDNGPEFAKWEQQARDAKVGLWKKMNPQEPWEYRKGQK